MTQYDNSGALFRNDLEGKSENFPPYGGSGKTTCSHCGAVSEFWISAWVKEAKSKFFSLAFKAKDQPRPDSKFSRHEDEPESKGSLRDDFEDSEVPF